MDRIQMKDGASKFERALAEQMAKGSPMGDSIYIVSKRLPESYECWNAFCQNRVDSTAAYDAKVNKTGAVKAEPEEKPGAAEPEQVALRFEDHVSAMIAAGVGEGESISACVKKFPTEYKSYRDRGFPAIPKAESTFETFAAAVQHIRANEKCSKIAAITRAAERFPGLHAVYRQTGGLLFTAQDEAQQDEPEQPTIAGYGADTQFINGAQEVVD